MAVAAARARQLLRKSLGSNTRRARKRLVIQAMTKACTKAAAALGELPRATVALEPLAREHLVPADKISNRLDRLRVDDEKALLQELAVVGSAFGKTIHRLVHDRAEALLRARPFSFLNYYERNDADARGASHRLSSLRSISELRRMCFKRLVVCVCRGALQQERGNSTLTRRKRWLADSVLDLRSSAMTRTKPR